MGGTSRAPPGSVENQGPIGRAIEWAVHRITAAFGPTRQLGREHYERRPPMRYDSIGQPEAGADRARGHPTTTKDHAAP